MATVRNPVLHWGKLAPMELSTVYNPNFPDRPHSVLLKHSVSDTRDAMWQWCGEMFGAHTKQWKNPRWAMDEFPPRFHFKNEEDAALFVLRWS